MTADQPRPPSVESVLALVRPRLGAGTDVAAVAAVVRETLDSERARLQQGEVARPAAGLAELTLGRLAAFAGPPGGGPVTVINATGVIVHTNLGRAAWPRAAVEAADRAATYPVLLEIDRATGRRGQRYREAEEHLIALTGAEDAIVTNNNAAALALAVGLARRRGVIVSRGELVEIGGGVRIPEIIRRSGARLVEVGTTNRTRAADYEEPLAEGRAAMILRVHPSNFRQQGFVETPDPVDLAELARRYEVPLVDDLGSGALIDTGVHGLAHEPTPSERLQAGAHIVTFSGDKLLGGPQAGLIAGRADLVARMRRDPFARATRPDKTTLAAVAATLGIYRAGRARLDIPVWRALAADLAELRSRASTIAADHQVVEIVDSEATVGGGALPGETLPSIALRLRRGSAARLAARLRSGDPCVVARVHDGAVWLDLRTVLPEQDASLAEAIGAMLA